MNTAEINASLLEALQDLTDELSLLDPAFRPVMYDAALAAIAAATAGAAA